MLLLLGLGNDLSKSFLANVNSMLEPAKFFGFRVQTEKSMNESLATAKIMPTLSLGKIKPERSKVRVFLCAQRAASYIISDQTCVIFFFSVEIPTPLF